MPVDLEFLDSCGHYDTATRYQKYENPGGCILVPGEGRFGVQAIKVGLFGSGPQITFKRNLTAVFVGAAIKIDAYGDGRDLLEVMNNGLTYAGCKVRHDARLLVATDLTGHAKSALSLATMDLHTWYYVELKVVIVEDTSLFAEFRLNEVPVASFTLLDTAGMTNGQFLTQATSFTPICPADAWLCDFYVHTTRYLGDERVRFIKPNAPGDFTDWAVTGAATAWQATSDVPPNGDTSYISSHTVGEETFVNMEDVDLEGGTCEGIQYLSNVRKTDANIRAIRPAVAEGGLGTLGAELSMPSDYVYTHDCLDVNPRTGIKWTQAQLNAIQSGVRLTI